MYVCPENFGNRTKFQFHGCKKSMGQCPKLFAIKPFTLRGDRLILPTSWLRHFSHLRTLMSRGLNLS